MTGGRRNPLKFENSGNLVLCVRKIEEQEGLSEDGGRAKFAENLLASPFNKDHFSPDPFRWTGTFKRPSNLSTGIFAKTFFVSFLYCSFLCFFFI